MFLRSCKFYVLILFNMTGKLLLTISSLTFMTITGRRFLTDFHEFIWKNLVTDFENRATYMMTTNMSLFDLNSTTYNETYTSDYTQENIKNYDTIFYDFNLLKTCDVLIQSSDKSYERNVENLAPLNKITLIRNWKYSENNRKGTSEFPSAPLLIKWQKSACLGLTQLRDNRLRLYGVSYTIRDWKISRG